MDYGLQRKKAWSDPFLDPQSVPDSLTFITLTAHYRVVMQPGHIAHFTLTIPEPFDFALTVAKPAGWHWSTPKEHFEHKTLWTAVRIGDIPVGLRMSARKNRVQVGAYTSSPLAKEETRRP